MTGRPPGPATEYRAAGFVVLRAPLLPFDEIDRWGRGPATVSAPNASIDAGTWEQMRQTAVAQLRELFERQEIREAVFLASPSLLEVLDRLGEQEMADAGRPVLSLAAYVARMAGRPTPFGLFATVTLGTVASPTSLQLDPVDEVRRHSRLDADYLGVLAASLRSVPAIRADLLYRPNSSLYAWGDGLRLVESDNERSGRAYRLVSIECPPHLRRVLDRAAQGATLSQLAAELADDDVTLQEAGEFLEELVDAQVLLGDLQSNVTGEEPLQAMTAKLWGLGGGHSVAEPLEEARTALHALDQQGVGRSPAEYRKIWEILQALPAEPDLSRLFQVDAVRPGSVAIAPHVAQEILRGAAILHRSFPGPRTDPLREFREAFVERYEGEQVPLAVALDEEAGVGFDRTTAGASPLLQGIEFARGEQPSRRWDRRDEFLVVKLAEALGSGSAEIELDEEELDSAVPPPPLPLADAFEVGAVIASTSATAIDRGDFALLLLGVDGPPGARLVGRFCHADPGIEQEVRRHLADEERLHPEAVFAEIVHLPQERLGNVVCRPVLRQYEIPYLGQTGAPPDRQLPISDLLVSVEDDRVVVHSKRLSREVVPRLTTAHYFGWEGNLPLYRFLCALQHQGVTADFGWTWGALEALPFLPRVCSGRLVLSRAQWNLRPPHVRELRERSGPERFRLVQEWRERWRIPRWVVLPDGDNELPIDLENPLLVEVLASRLREPSAALIELFPPPDRLAVSSPEGRFVSQIVVPFVRVVPRDDGAAAAARPGRSHGEHWSTDTSAVRRFPPGSEWLYAKLYSGSAGTDRLLQDVVRPVVARCLEEGIADRWFFIRYADPHWHLRVRLHGSPEGLKDRATGLLREAAAPFLDGGRLWRVQLDTYQPEVERYGGMVGMRLSEDVFFVDSEAAVEVLEQLSGDEGLDVRWRLTLSGIDRLLEALGLDLPAKLALAQVPRRALAARLNLDAAAGSDIGSRFRELRRGLEELVVAPAMPKEFEPRTVEAFSTRSTRLAPIVGALLEAERAGRLTRSLQDLAGSYAHLHINRMLRDDHDMQELVLFDFLERLYRSQAARTR